MKLSLIIPCYNEEACIEKFFKIASGVFSDEKYSVEYIFADDGSTDNTLKILKHLYKSSNEKITIISLSRNFGKESALYAGLKAAKGEYVCFIDADLQQRPELAAKMVSLLDKYPEYDCIGTFAKKRNDRSKNYSFIKRKFYSIISKASQLEFVEDASDFRCFRRNMADAILDMSEAHRFTKGLFSWVGFNTKYLPYEVQEREGGESKWNFFSLLNYALGGIIAFSNVPLRLPIYFGGLFSVFGIFYLLFYLIFTLAGHQSSSPLAIVIALLFVFSGIILIALGVVGEYVGKIHTQVKRRPIFIARETYTPANKEENVIKIEQQESYEAQKAEKIKEKKEKIIAAKKKQQNELLQAELKANENDFEVPQNKKEKKKRKRKKSDSAEEPNEEETDLEKMYNKIGEKQTDTKPTDEKVAK